MALFMPSEDMAGAVAAGGILVDAGAGQIDKLTDEQIRNMQEAAAVQAFEPNVPLV